jgi:hypothetical protein
MADRSDECENQNRGDRHMIGLSSALSLKKPGTMSTAELATRAQVGKSAVLLTIGHHDIPGLFGNAKNGLSGVFA